MLVIMRHAPTAWNFSKKIDDEILRGRFDLPPTDAGREEAKRNAEKLVRFGISEVWSSPYARDAETGVIVARITNARHLILEQMAPWNIGTLAGNKLRKVWPVIRELWRDPSLRPPGGESYGEFLDRWGPIVHRGLSYSRQGKNVVEIVQGTVVRSLPIIIEGRPPQLNKWEYVKPAEMIFLE